MKVTIEANAAFPAEASELSGEKALISVMQELTTRLKLSRIWLLQGTHWWESLGFLQKLGNPDWPTGLENRIPSDLIAMLNGLSEAPPAENPFEDSLAQIHNFRRRGRLLGSVAMASFKSMAEIQVLSKSRSVDLRVLAATNANIAEADVIPLATDAEAKVRCAAVLSGKLPNELVASMLIDADTSVRAAAARMGTFGEDVLRNLASDRNEEVRAGLASNQKLSSDLQRQLASDDKPSVRAALAGNKSGDPLLLDSLAQDKHYEVRIAAAGNPLSTAVNLRKLAADKKYPWVRRGVAQNAGTPDDLLLKLCSDSDSDVKDIAKKQMQDRRLGDTAVAMMLDDKSPEIRRLVAGNRHTPVAQMKAMLKDQHPTVRLSIAWNPMASTEVVAALLDDENETVRAQALGHPNVPQIALEKAVNDSDPSFRSAVARNQNSPIKLLEKLAEDPVLEVRIALLENRNLSLSSLRKLEQDVDDIAKYFPALVNAARSASSSPEDLVWTGQRSFLIARFVALANDNYPPQLRAGDKAKLRKLILERDEPGIGVASVGSESNLRIALTVLGLLPKLPEQKWLTKAVKSKDWLVRLAVSLSGIAKQNHFDLLAKDSDARVRAIARASQSEAILHRSSDGSLIYCPP